MCGLKPAEGAINVTGTAVTPRTGVWIETIIETQIQGSIFVTPRTGVWIETIDTFSNAPPGEVTPRTGVWIETS